MLNFVPSRKVERIVSLLISGGATDCFFVGGFVRDYFLGLQSKDIDIEVYGLTYERIAQILRRHFRVNFVGQSFGTIKIDNEIDINIPRLELKSSVGHKGFEISCDPNLDTFSAFSRRDFTINAIGMRIDGSVYDPFNGINDIKSMLLRAPTNAFCEDPLRVLRGMQFAARFGFSIEQRTVELCKRVFNEFNTISTERIWIEWSKWGLKGVELSRGLFLLQETDWVKHFPEIDELINVTKNQKSNPNNKICENKNTFVNTAKICDMAAKVATELNFDDEDRLVLVFAALCYNFGKSDLGKNDNNANDDLLFQKLSGSASNLKLGLNFSGVVSKSFYLARQFLDRMKPPLRIVDRVLAVVGERLTEEFVLGKRVVDDNILRHLSVRLEPSNIKIWAALCKAIILANGNIDLIKNVDECETRATTLGIINNKPKPILQGRDLIAHGATSGREMGTILNNAYKAQLDGDFNNIEEAIIWYNNYRNNKNS
ncbi:MAG: hypothetical protein LBH59_03385 [Planctomycetaceae bacterium]|jgi:tRNA nucleotidyltransferase (CCA-adding enzyme)|nr:hypothetical protein [Planctomycetaceae bacterium]